jgi:thiol-disulfide isomerase/thioredoxin
VSTHAARARGPSLLAIAIVTFTLAACERGAQSWPPGMRAEPPQRVAEIIATERGHPVLFALYASWCRACRAELPVLDEIDGRYRGRGLSVVALSLDDEPKDFGELMRERAPRSLALVRLEPVDEPRLTGALRALGADWTGSIPYVALFDRSGRLVRQWPAGGATESQLNLAVSEAL